MKKLFLIISVLTIALIILSFRFFEFFKPYLPYVNYLLGKNSPTSYLILLGNDTEIRANGGFAGSYAKLTLSSPPSTLYHLPSTIYKTKHSISFHDIYVPNGQTLDKYVAPPLPIQQAFGHGTWELANADYDPDFPTAATSLRWFFDKGGEINPDILGIINLSTIKKVLDQVGSFEVPQYQATLTPDNLYLFLQGKVESNFFPGSTQKADALHNVGTALLKKLQILPLTKKIKIAKILYQDLQNQNIVINSRDPDFQNFLVKNKLAGQYQAPDTTDYFGMVELNLGANKANAYITRQTQHVITSEKVPPVKGESPRSESGEGGSNRITHQINITFTNSSPEANPNPPLHYGGNYLAYLRLYLPQSAININITHSELATNSAGINPEILNKQNVVIASDSAAIYTNNSKQNFAIAKFWHITPAGTESNIHLSYDLPLLNQSDYSLTLLKQNGLPTSPQTLTIFNKPFSTSLTAPFTYPQ